MSREKYNVFCKGDVIRTNPEPGFYGVAVVLDDGQRIEISPGKWSNPMCHIAITPLLFQFEINIEDIDIAALKPMTFSAYYSKDGEKIPWREELCIGIYTNKNKIGLPIIGKVDNVSLIYSEPLTWTPQGDRFFLYGNVDSFLGRKAYISWCREKN
ncbi:MAG: hypothetical protein J6D08_10775 [Lachnospiraceae bacterium]|nr:hypothetical protein [Lachnospiraceae bacterium]